MFFKFFQVESFYIYIAIGLELLKNKKNWGIYVKKGYLIVSVIGNLSLGYLSIQLPKIIGNLTDAFVQAKPLVQSLFTLVAILAGINILSVINEYVTQSLGRNYADQIRNKLIAKYFRADSDILLGIGEYRQLFSADIRVLQQFFSIMLPKCIQQSVTLFLAVYAIGKLNGWLLLVILVPMLCYSLPAKYFDHRQKHTLTALRETQIESQAIVSNSLENKAEIYQFNNTSFFNDRFSKQQHFWSNLLLKVDISKNVFKAFPRTLDALAPALTFLVGGYLFMEKTITLGQLVSVLGYLTYINTPFKNFFLMLVDLQQAIVAQRSIGEYLRLNEIKSGDLPLKELQQLTILQNEHTVVELFKGDHLYLIGETGSGKTTLFNTLCGYDTGTDIEVRYNQRDISLFKRKDLRQQISLVAQQGIILPKTIQENICPTSECQLLPAEQKFFENWVKRFEAGKHTVVNEDDALLSGGERQVIWILRSLAQAKGVVLLDEVTASLDNDLAQEIKKLLSARQDLILIEILHRTNQLKATDKVLYLNKGKLMYGDFGKVGVNK